MSNYDQQIKELKEDVRVLERVLAQVVENAKRNLDLADIGVSNIDESAKYLTLMGETGGFIKVTNELIKLKKKQIEWLEAGKQIEEKNS